MRYKHTQPGYVTGLSLVAGAALTYFSFRADGGTVGGIGLAVTGGLLAGAVLFSSLTTVVTDEELRFYFGPGFWMRRFALDDIEAAEPVRNSAWYGWGIRYTPHGWLYNVSGLQAVELTLRGEGQIRIGTDEPETLKQALDRAGE
jgi:hypothetical protein